MTDDYTFVSFMKDKEVYFIDWVAIPRQCQMTLSDIISIAESDAIERGAIKMQANVRGAARQRLWWRYGFDIITTAGEVCVMEKIIVEMCP